MKRHAVPLLLVLCLAACVDGKYVPLSDLPPPGGEPAGYYPGQGRYIEWPERDGLQRYVDRNEAGIAEIQRQIIAIRSGTLEPGCIGKEPFTCVATLAQTLAIGEPYGPDPGLFDPIEADVNGNPTFPREIILGAFIGGDRAWVGAFAPPMTVTLTLDDEHHVSRMKVQLVSDPSDAHTKADYDQTGLYDIVKAAGGAACSRLSRLDVYRFYENDVKPKRRDLGQFRKKGPDGFVDEDVAALNMLYCGRLMSFHSFSGYTTGRHRHTERYGAVDIR